MELPKFIPRYIGEYKPVDHGVKADCVRVGESGLVYKARKKAVKTAEEAERLAGEMQRDYRLLSKYLGPYVSSTQFVIGDGSDGPTVFAFQEEIKDGMSIKQALKLARKENLSIEHIVDLYSRAGEMYKATGNPPDFNGTGRFLGWPRPNSTRNVLVTVKEVDGQKMLWPNVVDVGLIREGYLTQRTHKGVLARSIFDQHLELSAVGRGTLRVTDNSVDIIPIDRAMQREIKESKRRHPTARF